MPNCSLNRKPNSDPNPNRILDPSSNSILTPRILMWWLRANERMKTTRQASINPTLKFLMLTLTLTRNHT